MKAEEQTIHKQDSEPWFKFYENVAHHLSYPLCSMYDFLQRQERENPKLLAYEFEGKKVDFCTFLKEIRTCAKALWAMGVRENDVVTICLPNVPQAIIMFYALNYIGAIANMVHPLSGENEISFFLRISKSKAAITLDRFYEKFEAIKDKVNLDFLIVAKVQDKLPAVKKAAYTMFVQKKYPPLPKNADYILWTDFLERAEDVHKDIRSNKDAKACSVILYSGGTTGTMKGIELSSYNFNALAMQTVAMGNCVHKGDTMLAVMPVFHGFGLGIGIHTVLTHGGNCVLVAQFSLKGYSKLLKKKQPNFIAGVPTIYEALLRSPMMEDVDLSCLKGVFSGGDSLSIELKKKVDKFLKDHGANVQIREGYGTTECVTASCLTPKDYAREGSIGIPFPDTYYKIVKPNTDIELPYGEEGEIVLSGPTVMIGYLNNPEETAITLVKHKDGRVWLHTGDLGMMDEDGFIYFKQRLKRMIVTSGYNVYPSQLENIIDAHPDVIMSCVIGVKDDYKMAKIKAYVVLKPGVSPDEKEKEKLREYCTKNMAKYAIPYDFEFREDLPKTLVGKVAYTVLEKENALALKQAKEQEAGRMLSESELMEETQQA